MLRTSVMVFACAFIALVILMAITPSTFTAFPPNRLDLGGEFRGITAQHPFGQGVNGIDIFSNIVHGARTSLLISILVVLISMTIGIALGSWAALGRPLVDRFVSGLIDLVFSFPGILLAISLAAVVGSSMTNIIILLSITGWPSVARLVRGEVLRLRNQEFVIGAVALGAHSIYVFLRHILPNMIPLLCIQASFSMAGVIIVESSLSFLGLGMPAGTPTWGGLLSMGKVALLKSWHVTLFPGLMIMLLVLSFNYLGDWLRDKLDPRTRQI